MAYPLLPRLLVGVLAVLVLSNTASAALAADVEGLPRTALAQWLVGAALAGFLAVLAVFPAELQALVPARSRVDLRRPAHHGAVVAAAGALYVVVGLAGVIDTVHGLELSARGEDPFGDQSQRSLLVGLALNAVVLVGAPLLWVAAMEPGGHVLRALGLRRERALRSFALGVGFALASLLLVAAIVVVLASMRGPELPVNERALGIAAAVTPLGALLLAAGSGVVEEVFFRGWLQPRIGLLGQATVFAVAHLNYLHIGETVAVFALALVFGGVFRATGNLWAPVGAHFAFNLVMLLAASGS